MSRSLLHWEAEDTPTERLVSKTVVAPGPRVSRGRLAVSAATDASRSLLDADD